MPAVCGLVFCCCLAVRPAFSGDNPAQPSEAHAGSRLYLKVQVDNPVKISRLEPGDAVEGKLAIGVYSRDQELFPAGSAVRLTVDKLGRRKRTPNDHWRWVVKFFTPRHENYPVFISAVIGRPEGGEVVLPASLIAINPRVDVRAPAKKPAADAARKESTHTPADHKRSSAQPADAEARAAKIVVALEADRPAPGESNAAASSKKPSSVGREPTELAAGTLARVILLDPISASKNRPGDVFLARLVEPVRVEGTVALPEGSLFEGRVLKRTPPKMLSRAGSVLLSFTRLIVPGADGVPIAASVGEAELDPRSRTKIDPEGRLRGDHPGKARMLINIGTTAGIAKVADDGTQLVLEAIVSTATDASTAGTARIVATCVSGLFLLTRHGRDVVLPRFTEMNLVFDRPVTIAPPDAEQTTP